MKCMTCSVVEIKDKFLSPKLDILQKHVGRKKRDVVSIGIEFGDWYYNKDSTHVKNEKLYGSTCIEAIIY